jgi:hypothetical protein
VQINYDVVYIRISLVQLFVLLHLNFKEVIQIIELRRFGGAPNSYPFAALLVHASTGHDSHERQGVCAWTRFDPGDVRLVSKSPGAEQKLQLALLADCLHHQKRRATGDGGILLDVSKKMLPVSFDGKDMATVAHGSWIE